MRRLYYKSNTYMSSLKSSYFKWVYLAILVYLFMQFHIQRKTSFFKFPFLLLKLSQLVDLLILYLRDREGKICSWMISKLKQTLYLTIILLENLPSFGSNVKKSLGSIQSKVNSKPKIWRNKNSDFFRFFKYYASAGNHN